MSEHAIRKQFMDNYLIEELFQSKRGGYSICLYAGYALIALCIDNLLIENAGSQFWFFISEQDAFTLVKNSANGSDRSLFRAALDKTETIFTFQQPFLDEAIKLKKQVECGEKESLVSEEGLRTLKEKYVAQLQKEISKYGTPPQFSDAKYGECLIACFFSVIGAPYCLVGRPLPALLCMALTCLIMLNPIFMFLMGVNMIFSFLFVCAGRLKDRKGRYVLSAGQKEGVMNTYNLIERYKKELA